jgi:lipopolysaccharide export system permease protein
LIRAQEGSLYTDAAGDKYVVLENGNRVKRVSAKAAPNEYELARFDRYGVRMTGNEVKDDPLEERAKDTMTLLREGAPTGLGQVFYRLSVPLAGISLVLLAIPLAYVNPRLGRSINLIVAILLLMITLNLMNVVQTKIGSEVISLPAALFLFHASLAALVGAVFYRRYRGAVFGSRRAPSAGPSV